MSNYQWSKQTAPQEIEAVKRMNQSLVNNVSQQSMNEVNPD